VVAVRAGALLVRPRTPPVQIPVPFERASPDGLVIPRLGRSESLPQGLVQVVHGTGDVGSALVDAGIDACVFTGSPATGRKVRVQCAERGIPWSIEMGGKDAAIVLADAPAWSSPSRAMTIERARPFPSRGLFRTILESGFPVRRVRV
jgi:hypothetical protein